jgi:hypothetical protein
MDRAGGGNGDRPKGKAMTAEYRKLPGKRRGFLNVSSVWAGPDHLLLVRGSRFREEYKRFYYRDVQAIGVARAPRFHISTRSGLIAYLVLLAGLISLMVRGYIGTVSNALGGLGAVALVLVAVWVFISAAQSCRCRIYTAVSADELPSVYRMWTARRFLQAVEPLIAQTQGTIDGAWAAAAEERAVGPLAAAARVGRAAESPAAVLPRRGLASDLFLASLAADGLAKFLPLPAPLGNWLPFVTELLTAAGAVGVIVQYNRGRLRAGMNRVAVASLIAFGLLYYVQSGAAGMSATLTAARTGKRTVATAFPQSRLADQAGAGIDAILIIVGLMLSLREDEDRRRGLLG